MPKVSVVIPTYNRERLIKIAIDSVLVQTNSDFEILVVDDGSTDNTQEVVRKINDERIKYIYKQNGGVSSARNRGIKEAVGEYICFLDSDDSYDPRKIESQVKVLDNKKDIDVCYHLVVAVDEKGVQFKKKPKEKYIIKNGNIFECLLKKEVFLHICTLMVRIGVARKTLFNEDMETTEDVEFIYRLAYGHKMFGISEFLFFFKEHQGVRLSHRDALKYENSRRQLLKSFIDKTGCRDKKILRLLKSRLYYDIGEVNILLQLNLFKFYKFIILSLFYNPLNLGAYKYILNPIKVLKKIRRQFRKQKIMAW